MEEDRPGVTLYRVRRSDGRYISHALSNYTVRDGSAYLWTRHPARAHEFGMRERAEEIRAAAIKDEPDCGAEVIDRELP